MSEKNTGPDSEKEPEDKSKNMPENVTESPTENAEQSQQAQAPEEDEKPSIWIRGLYMLLFAVIVHIAELVIGLVMVIQFVLKAATDKTNDNLLSFGEQMGRYVREIVQFETFNTEEKPFPFNPWPKNEDTSE